jgi:VanZ family protein
MWNKLEPWIYRLAALGWMGLIFLQSSKPGSKVKIEPPVDKAIHMGAFGVLAFLLALGAGRRLQRHVLWAIPVLGLVLGILDEFHQSFSPGRSVSLGDVAADFAGATVATFAWWLAWRQGRARAFDTNRPSDRARTY